MRKLFYLMLALPLAFAACDEEPAPTPEPEVKDPVLTLAKDTIDVAAEGGVATVEYTLENAKEGAQFSAECEAEWISNFVYGETITFDVAANDGDAREATVTIKYDVVSKAVTVKQAAKSEKPDNTPSFTLTSDATMEFGQDEAVGTITFELKNPIQGASVTATANVEWISQVTPQESKIVFAVAANTGDAREGKITAVYGVLSFEVTVKQAAYVAPAPVINLESTALTVDAAGGANSVAYTLENAVDGVSLEAVADVDWISGLTVAEDAITFDVAANDGGIRNGNIVLTYGEVSATVTVQQLPENANPDLTYKVYGLEWIKAETRAANVWNVIFAEYDDTLGEMYSRITVQLAEDSPMLIPDGTYSVANGGIILSTTNGEGYSEYRYNSDASLIADATLVIANDKENATTTLSCSFQVGNEVFTFEYSGAMEGFMYEEIGDEGITNWERFFIYSQWDDTKYVVGESSSVKVELYLKKLGGQGTDPLAVGTYPVGAWEYITSRDYCESGSSKVNGVSIVSGEVVVEDDAAGYKLTFNVVDKNGTEWKGTYVGPISA